MGILRKLSGVFPLVFALSLLAGEARAAESIVHLKDGSKVKGEVVDEDNDQVQLKVKFGTITYKRSEIASIEKLDAGGPASAEAAEWRDVIVLKSGETLKGFLASEHDTQLFFDVVMSGKAVSKSLLARTTIPRNDIREIRRLTDAQRAKAREYLKHAGQDEERDALAQKDLRVETTELTSKDGKRKKLIKKVELEHFIIVADMEEDFLRETAYRLGKVFNAYKQYFGVDRNQSEKVRVIIFNSLADYYEFIGRRFMNPAFYHRELKLIAAGFAVAEHKAAIAAIRKRHAELNRQLQDQEAKIDKARAEVRRKVNELSGRLRRAGRTTVMGKAIMKMIRRLQIKWEVEVMRMAKPLKDIQLKIKKLNRRNDALFEEHTRLMVRALYHEGFHAFLDQFLFDEKLVKHVPRWLDEGLAQYFELARVEGPRLIIGQEDRSKMTLLRRLRREGTLVPLGEILTGTADDYLVHEIGNVEHSRKHYHQAWFLVHLMGKGRRLKREHLRTFVQALADGRPPMEALPLLAGMSNDQLESQVQLGLGGSIRVRSPGTR